MRSYGFQGLFPEKRNCSILPLATAAICTLPADLRRHNEQSQVVQKPTSIPTPEAVAKSTNMKFGSAGNDLGSMLSG